MISWISGVLLQRYSDSEKERQANRKKHFLEQFYPLSWWMHQFQQVLFQPQPSRRSRRNQYIIFILNRQGIVLPSGEYHHFTKVTNYAVFPYNLAQDHDSYPKEIREFQRSISEHNQIIPPEIWPQVQDEAPWDSLPSDVHKRFQQDSELYFSKWQVPDQQSPIEPSTISQTDEWPSLALGRPVQHLGLTQQYPAHTSEGLRIRQRLYETNLPQPISPLGNPGPRSSTPDLNLSLSSLPLGPPGHYFEDSQNPYQHYDDDNPYLYDNNDNACACQNPNYHEPQCNMGTP